MSSLIRSLLPGHIPAPTPYKSCSIRPNYHLLSSNSVLILLLYFPDRFAEGGATSSSNWDAGFGFRNLPPSTWNFYASSSRSLKNRKI